MTLYFDTSALVKRYVTEAGTPWLRERIAIPSQVMLISRLTLVEMDSAFARRIRESPESASDVSAIANIFKEHCESEYHVVELDQSVTSLARGLLYRYPLRASDAVQLASAIRANQALLAEGLQGLLFLSADQRLLDVAGNEGLTVDNPAQHV